jgi:hypothetical protein
MSTNDGYFPPPPPEPAVPAKKSGCLKWGLIGCGALVVLALLAIGAMFFFFSRNDEEIAARTGQVRAEAARAGAQTDEAGCMRLAQERTEADVIGALASGEFAGECLRHARETPGFCDGVPAPDAGFRATLSWTRAQCPQGGAGCQQAAQGKLLYCAAGRPKAAGDALPAGGDSARAAEDTAGWNAASDST